MTFLDNMYAIVGIVVVGFVVVAYVGYSIADAVWLQKSRIRRRVDELGAGKDKQEPESPEPAIASDDPLPTIAKFITTRGFTDKLLLMLVRAGIKLRPSEFVGLVCGIALLLALIGAVLFKSIAVEVLAIAIGILGPYAYVKSLQARRLVMFNRQLPDALSLIGSAIRSGYSFPRAMQMVADEMPDPISEEFQRVINEINVGLPIDAALMRMTARITSYDLELVVIAVIIQQQIGGNLAEIINNIAETIRDRVRVEGELSALTAEGRMSGVVLVLLPFGLAAIILTLNSGYLSPLIHEPSGPYLIGAGLLLQAVGALIIKRMLVLDY